MAKAMVVMVAMPVVVVWLPETLLYARPMLERLRLEMSTFVEARSRALDTASGTATLCPRWGGPSHGRHQTEHQHATGKSPEYSPVLPCHGLCSFYGIFSRYY
jgi:hypothetical protein